MNLKKIAHNKALLVLLATDSLVSLAYAMLGPIYAFFIEGIGGGVIDAGVTAGVLSLSAGIASLFSGYFLDKIKEKEFVLIAGYLLIGLGFYLYLWTDTLWKLLLVQILIGISDAVVSPAFDVIYSQHLDKGQEGIEWASWESLSYFVEAIGAVIGGGIVAIFGFEALFIIMGSICVLSAIYIYFLPRKLL